MGVNGIAALSATLSAVRTSQAVQTTMVKKSLETMEQTGKQIAEMIAMTSVSPTSLIDIKL